MCICIGGQWFEIEEPPSASIASKGSPNSSTQKETEVLHACLHECMLPVFIVVHIFVSYSVIYMH